MNYQQLKKIEKLMSMSSRQFHPNLEEAFQKMLDTIGFLDKLDNTNRLDIINVLYNSGKRKCTYAQISSDLFMSDSKLRRTRIFFAECFEYFLNKVDNAASSAT